MAVLTASVSFCGEFASQSDRPVPIFQATGIYAEKPQAPIELVKPPASEPEMSEEERSEYLKTLKETREQLDSILGELDKLKVKTHQQPVVKQAVPTKTAVHHDYSAYSPWFESGTGTTSDRHLVQVHGANPQELRGMSQDQKNRLHGMYHGERPRGVQMSRTTSTPMFSQGGCPNGNCPTGILGRRRR